VSHSADEQSDVLQNGRSLATIFTLAACATGPAYSDLDRVATTDDAWPVDLPAYSSDDLNPESSRLVGRDGTTALYLAVSTMPRGGVCLPVYPDNDKWVVGCGTDGMSVNGGGDSSYTVHRDGADTDGTAISDNVYAN